MTYQYKWLLDGLITPVQHRPWPVAVGEWTPAETPVICESGWHAMQEKDVLEHLPTTLGAQLWLVETKGEVVHGADKFASESMRLVQHVGTTDARNLRLFACDVAEDALSQVEDPDPRSLNAIAVARQFAVGEATLDELTAAWAAWAAETAARAARDAALEKYSNWLVVRLWEDR